MSSVLDQLKEIDRLINQAKDVYESDADIKFKYDVIFKLNIKEKIIDIHGKFEWPDYDDSYEMELERYMSALFDYQKNIGLIFKTSASLSNMGVDII